MKTYSTYAAIDLSRIEANFRAVCQKAGVPAMAVVKADAYGHGAVAVARVLEEQCAFFGVAMLQEALELRQAGIQKPILVLGHTPPECYADAIKAHIRPAIFHYEDALLLSQTAVALGMDAPFHFALDTGMSRIGFQATEESAALCARIAALPGLIPEGLFSHFATSDCADLSAAQAQAARFDAFDKMLRQRGVNVAIRHLDNSAGVMNFSCHYDMVRAGIVIYGLYPSDEVSPELLQLQPALSWHSHISHIKVLEPGRAVSYGGTYVTEKPTTVATVPVGYADGYRRCLSSRFYVLIRGKKAPILGRICMDQMMVDVTDIPDVQLYDKVVLVGKSGDAEITAEEISRAGNSFNYEFVCNISRRVPRLYYKDGKLIHQVHYLLDK